MAHCLGVRPAGSQQFEESARGDSGDAAASSEDADGQATNGTRENVKPETQVAMEQRVVINLDCTVMSTWCWTHAVRKHFPHRLAFEKQLQIAVPARPEIDI